MNRSVATGLIGIVALTVALAGCQGTSAPEANGQLKKDGTFTIATASDPGSLDPHGSFSVSQQQLMTFLYDSPVKVVDSKVLPQLAVEWSQSPTEVVLTLREGVLCNDGTELMAQDVADNVNWVGDPVNGSLLTGIAVPAGTTAAADDATGVVTITAASPSPFLLDGLSWLPIICRAGLDDRSMLERASVGTGPYELVDSVPGDHYTLERRDDYAWGPDGATTAEPGVPKTIVHRVVESEATVTNLLLSGEVNAATVTGSDEQRLEAADFFNVPRTSIRGELIYNQADGRPGADEATRVALTQALDRDELKAISTDGKGETPRGLTGSPVCADDDFVDSLPARDLAAAESGLSEVAGPLKMIYAPQWGSETAEAAVEMWRKAGVEVEATALSTNDIFDTLYSTGDWDIVWFPADGNTPTEVMSNFSGPSVADGGNNFASIHNQTYDELAAEALRLPGTEGCDLWLSAERSLLESADVVPFSLKVYRVWGSKATFETDDSRRVLPTTIRLQG